jgi:YD repeat-containing protein
MIHKLKFIISINVTIFVLINSSVLGFADEEKIYYDEAGQMVKSLDATGMLITYVYDESGNRTEIIRSVIEGLAIFEVTPSKPRQGAIVNIRGQNFSAVLSENNVTLNGLALTVLAADASMIKARLPVGAKSGYLQVSVASAVAESPDRLIVIAAPVISGLDPIMVVTNPDEELIIPAVLVTGSNLTESVYRFEPEFIPASIMVTDSSGNEDGTQATLELTLKPEAAGSFTLIASNSEGESQRFSLKENTVTVLYGGGDEDGDGLNNYHETLAGSDIFDPDSDKDGFPDGAEVADGSSPVNPSSLPISLYKGLGLQFPSIRNSAFVFKSEGSIQISFFSFPFSLENTEMVFTKVNSSEKHIMGHRISLKNQAPVFPLNSSGSGEFRSSLLSVENKKFVYNGRALSVPYHVNNLSE